MSSSTGRGYPYPQFSDSIDVLAGYFENLAEAVDADVEALSSSRPRWNGTFSGTIASASSTALTPTSVVSEGGMSVSGTEITVPEDGEYEIGVSLRYASQGTAAGARVARFNVNGSDRGFFTATATTAYNATNMTANGVSRLLLSAGDKVVFQAFQTAGTSLALTGDCHAWIDRIPQ